MIGTRISRRSKVPPALPQLVADEEIARDPLDLLAVHEEVAAPPALELEEARRLGVGVGEHLVVLVDEGVGRIQVLEVLHQVRAVEFAVAEVRRERREPRAAEDAAGVAHRVVAFAVTPCAAPVGHRRADDHERPGLLGLRGGEHHRRPAGLAVADDRRLGALRMQRAHLVHELALRRAHVEQRLPGLRIAEEDDEVDRVSRAQRDADLRVVLEAADAGAVAAARVDDDVRAPLGSTRHALGRDDAHKRIVDRLLAACARRAPSRTRSAAPAAGPSARARGSCCRAGAACPRRSPRAARSRSAYCGHADHAAAAGCMSLRCLLHPLAEPLGCGLQPVSAARAVIRSEMSTLRESLSPVLH